MQSYKKRSTKQKSEKLHPTKRTFFEISRAKFAFVHKIISKIKVKEMKG